MLRIMGKLGLQHHNLKATMGGRGVPVVPIRAVTTPEFVQHDRAYDWSPAVKQLTILGNDVAGDCVEAMLLNYMRTVLANNGIDYEPTTEDALALYSAITGYDPKQSDPQGNNPTDNGTEPAAALDYFVKTGTKEGFKIRAFLSIDPHDINHMKAAIQYLGGVCAAVMLPSDAQQQFEANKPWVVSSLAALNNPLGGHGIYVPAFELDQRGNTWFTADTWAERQPFSGNWWWGCGMQAYAVISDEFLKNGNAPNGLDLQALEAYLQRVAN